MYVSRGVAGCLAILLLSLGVSGFAGAKCQAGFGATLQAIKGVGAAPLASARQVTVAGTVTAVFIAPHALGGFFLQQSGTGGRPPVGIFVYQPHQVGNRYPSVGERVVLSARTGRYRGRIQLEQVTRTQICGPNRALRAWPLSLPAKPAHLRRLEGVLVRVPTRLTVTSNAQLARYGTLGLSVGGRLFQSENRNGAVAGEPAGILLDDSSYHARPRPVPYLDGTGTRRLGSALIELTGVLTQAFGRWRIQPNTEPRFRATNPRPTRLSRRAGTLRLASFNMENYFISRGRRGADSAAAFRRQQRKLVDAIVALDADVLALHEVENRRQAVAVLVRAVNAASPSGAARYLAAAAGADYGSDAIRTVLLYREQRLAPISVWINEDPVFIRPPLAANFRRLDGDRATFGVLAAHLKSKGGCLVRGDSDQGRGCWGRLRDRQAVALSQWLRRLQAAVHQPRFLLMGDLNSYPGEAAVQTLLSAGLRDLIAERVAPAGRYTYVYHGYAGYLDHALATVALADTVEQVAIWHINADEPRHLDYTNSRVKPTFYRSSDHDPVVVDLR